MHQDAERFIARIQAERQLGYGFVPFVGAGFSALSGAPLVWEIKAYLQRCICVALGAEESGMRPWNPRTDRWPPFIDRDRPGPDDWWGKVYNEFQRRRVVDPWHDELAVFQEALGAMAEWRTSLLFLSRLVRDRRGTGAAQRDVLSLDAPRQEIIDACFREVLKDKYPALGHRMLAVLSGALRLDLLLTTNFDDLLEKASAAARNPLEVFEVPLGSNLPDWPAVSSVRSLIKLHGNRYSLRADYTLDVLPSEQDKQRFLEYLLSSEGRRQSSDAGPLPFQNHLLVIGVSGNDRRTRSVIEHAWKKLGPSFRVFWLCYSEQDVRRIQEFTAEVQAKSDKGEDWEGSIILRYTDAGLLLLQLYQTIRRNLPPSGGLFPSASRVSAPPLPSSYVEGELLAGRLGGRKSFCEELKNQLESFQAPAFSKYKLVVASSDEEGPRSARGVSSACAAVFRQMEAENICIWLDMNDISSAENLFEVLLESAYFKLGLENWTPVHVVSEPRRLAAEIRRLVSCVDMRWVIFLNARETPGANTASGGAADAGSMGAHGWLDCKREHLPKDTGDGSECVEAFIELLMELCGPYSPRISVVLICRKPAGESQLLSELRNKRLLSAHVELTGDSLEWVEFDENRIVASAIKWTAARPEESSSRRRFLHALVLMQRPRLLATIWSPAVSTEGRPGEFADNRPGWVNELEEIGLVRRKPGGLIWIHVRCRQKIRNIFWERDEGADWPGADRTAVQILRDWSSREETPGIHRKIAAWYEKVLEASDSPWSVFEAVYHHCRSAETYVAQRVAGRPPDAALDELEAASAVLRQHSFLIQTHGYSRGSCRRLEFIRKNLCDGITANWNAEPGLGKAIKRLRVVCTDVMRAIAREVGEDGKAFLRHRQFGVYLAGGLWTKDSDRPPAGSERYYSTRLHEALCPPNGSPPHSSAPVEWLRWWRWSGMLGIASRSFGEAESALNTSLHCATRDLCEFPDTPPNVEWEKLMRGEFAILSGQKPSGRQAVRVELLRTIEQLAAVKLLIDSVAHRVATMGARSDSNEQLSEAESLERTLGIERLIAHGLEMVAQVRGNDHSSDGHYARRANWCASRLLMHASMCAVRRVQLDWRRKGSDIPTAMGLLGDAEASLGLGIPDPRRHRAELALVELHRAEVRLREAEAAEIRLPAGSSPFSWLCRKLQDYDPPAIREDQTGFVRQILDEQRSPESFLREDLRRAKSLVWDALRFLNRAEPVLRERRRNVWWTTWFFERRLRAIALYVWASVFETDAPIPYLGLEAAMHKTATVADQVLDDAIRMIRVDAYRLATIIDSYASCAKALQTRLVLDENSPRIPDRQRRMCQSLRDSLDDLSRVQELRAANPWNERSGMDARVTEYVARVQTEASRIAKQLKDPV
jgi:hypothetical protein